MSSFALISFPALCACASFAFALYRQLGECTDCRMIKKQLHFYALRITHYALRITHYALRITHYALRITHYALRWQV